MSRNVTEYDFIVINYIDTAPSYGNGNSESIIGEATEQRRDHFVLATKVGYRNLTAQEVTTSVEDSLRRLRTDRIDIIQFHSGMYTDAEVQHILNDGLIDVLDTLRDQGKVRFLGFTVEEPWIAQPLIASGAFDVMQVRYTLIYQAAALHVLNQARRRPGRRHHAHHDLRHVPTHRPAPRPRMAGGA